MGFKTKLMLICLILVLFNVVAVSAADDNLNDDNYLSSLNQVDEPVSIDSNLDKVNASQSDKNNGSDVLSSTNDVSKYGLDNVVEKEDITLTPVSTNIIFGDSFKVHFKDQDGKSYPNLPVFVRVDGKNIKAGTDKDGYATFSLEKCGAYSVELIYLGNGRFNPYSKVVKINVKKLDVSLTPVSTTLFGGESLRVHFKDQDGKSYPNLPVFVRVDGKNIKAGTDKGGYASFSINKGTGKVSVELIYLGNGRFNPYSKVVSIDIKKYDVTLTPVSTTLFGGESLRVHFKDQDGKSYPNLPVFVRVDGKNIKAGTDNEGYASFSINKGTGKVSVELIYLGNGRFNPYSKVVSIDIKKYDVTLTPVSTTLDTGEPFKVIFKDQFNMSYPNLPVFVRIDGKLFKVGTDKEGYATFDLDVHTGKYLSAELIYQGNGRFNPFSKVCSVLILKNTSIIIGNDKLLNEGYLRIYLKSDEFWAVAKQTLSIAIGNKNFYEQTNNEGIVIIKPDLGQMNFTVDVTYKGTDTVVGSHASKNVEGINGNPIDPLSNNVPLKNGMPDIDYMTANYVMADGDMTYTVLKSQYQEVLQRDSYCLFLNNKLTKYTLFKTKLTPTLNHLIHRTKWNVIERELFKSLVLANKHNYWPSEVSASLKGKAYTYSEVRDVQDTDYTCGPTASSMCSQVLKNYLCESYLASLSGSQPEIGTPLHKIVSVLEKNNFKCTYFYKNSYENALNELKKGGCAVVFHTKNHYVAILDISKDGKYVLVSNSYGSFYNIPSEWVSSSYMKTRYYKNYDDGLIVRLSYTLSQSTKNNINQFYSSMGSWTRQNTQENFLVDY